MTDNIEFQSTEENSTNTQTDNLAKLSENVDRVKNELSKIIVGQDSLVELLIISIIADGHALIEGVPGIAKTLTAKMLAKTLDIHFSRIQFTPDLMPSDILGTSVFNQKTSNFEYKKGPVFTNILLIDEINRAPAKTQAALFEVMAEKQITMDGSTYKLERPFIVLATQNPIEQEGTYRLPEAQLDRFLFKIEITYPELADEISIISNFNKAKGLNLETEVLKILTASDINELQQIAQSIIIEQNLIEYIAKIVVNTRSNSFLFLAASPRASLAIMNAAKAKAAISGRNFIIPEDIKYVALPALRHRVIVSPEKEMEGISADFIISQILDSIEIPR